MRFSLLRATWALAICAAAAYLSSCRGDSEAGTAPAGPQRDAGTVDQAAADTAHAPDAGPLDGVHGPPSSSCTIATDKTKPVTVASGREIHCAIDVGSNNVKLIVASMERGRPATIRDERQCRTRLGFGAKVFDENAPVGMQGRPLPRPDLENLISVMKEFQDICLRDGGKLVGADATQWARDATNMGEVILAVKAATGVTIDVLTPEQEGLFGYVAATRSAPRKIALDPGSNSFQIGFWVEGEQAPRTVSVPFGYVRAAAKYFANEADPTIASYEAARSRYVVDAKDQIEAALVKLTPSSSLAALKKAVGSGALSSEVHVLGQDGAVHLAVRDQLRDAAGAWIKDKEAYDLRVAMEKPTVHAAFGEITALLAPADLTRYVSNTLKMEDFAALRAAPIRALYGEKAMVVPALLELLVRELGLDTVALVPQEMPTGYILSKLQ